MQKTMFLRVSASLLILLVLSACSQSTSSASTSNFPTGKFIKSGTNSHGLIFNKDGTFSVFDNGATLATGTYSVDGDTYIEESNNQGCSTPMKFKYTFDGTTLSFNYLSSPNDDACDGRRGDFDNQTYTLSK